MDDYIETNRRHWDELVPLHVQSEHYRVAQFKAGESRLKPVERAEMGDVRGKTLLHLQCHFGLDTLSWAREGAIVTGIDFSEPAIEAARALAYETGIDARFLVSDVYGLPDRLEERFDIVFTSYGAIFWLPDVEKWAKVVAHFLKPGGFLYMVEFHPVAGVFEWSPDVAELQVKYPYFPVTDPLMFENDGSYADPAAKLQHKRNYSWPHPLSEVVTSLIDAGLRIDSLHEFPFSVEKHFAFMQEDGLDSFRMTEHDGSIPLLYSIRATKLAS